MAGARVCERVGAERAEGCIARLRLGDAVLVCDGLEVRDRVLGVDRVTWVRSLTAGERLTAPVRDGAVGRGATLAEVGVLDVAPAELLAELLVELLAEARGDRSGVVAGARALLCVVLIDPLLRGVEETTRRPAFEGRIWLLP